ncbi:YdcF family protein [Agarivorans sp.]|uniref:YdcF family protein n=1 Tax=Agarivorans sp. TaxID=1872412 RepID=UPI003D013C97
MSGFALKKLLTLLLMPSTALCLLLALAFLLCLFKRRRLAMLLGCTSLLLIFGFSLYPLSGAMLRYWEKQYSALQQVPEDTELIVVLGCLHYVDSGQPITSQLLPCATIKVAEAVRLWRQQPQAKILLSGGDIQHSGAQHADMLAQLALALGVPETQLIRSYQLKNTADEAANVARNHATKHLVLVTQASHMPRAMHLFEMQGLQPVAAPTDYVIKNWQAEFTWQSFIPSLRHIAKADRAVYEGLAMLWLRLAG